MGTAPVAYTGSKALAGRGTIVSIGGLTNATGTEIWTEIGEISECDIDGSKWDTVDVSNFQSGSYKEFIATMQDAGSLKMDGSRVSSDAGQLAVEAAYITGLKYNWKVQLPINLQGGQSTTGDLFEFSGLVESRVIPIGVMKKVAWTVTVKLSGPPTYSAGA